jgi:hypothetical protein
LIKSASTSKVATRRIRQDSWSPKMSVFELIEMDEGRA